jgi:hypothetical protein
MATFHKSNEMSAAAPTGQKRTEIVENMYESAQRRLGRFQHGRLIRAGSPLYCQTQIYQVVMFASQPIKYHRALIYLRQASQILVLTEASTSRARKICHDSASRQARNVKDLQSDFLLLTFCYRRRSLDGQSMTERPVALPSSNPRG